MISSNSASLVRRTCLALAVGAAGAAVALMLSLPAAALIGSCLAVSAVAGAGVPVALPTPLRDVAFVIIGVSLGAGVEADILAQARNWTVSLVMLAASLVATVAVGAAILRRGFGYDAGTAVLSSSPGTMSYSVAVALEGRGDATVVTTLQLVRLLMMVTTVPLLVAALGLVETHAPAPQTMQPSAVAVLVAAGYATGTVGGRLGLPAACLLAGMMVSSAAHVIGLAEGAAPGWAVTAGFLLTGTALGTRLRSLRSAEFADLLRAGIAVVLSTTLLSFAFAAATAALTGLPLGEVWIAFAPGGVEAMAAVGLALGYDPAFVALHHFTRIVILLALIPAALGVHERSGKK